MRNELANRAMLGIKNDVPGSTTDASPRKPRSRRLRRWSVAELIAQAAARPQRDGFAR